MEMNPTEISSTPTTLSTMLSTNKARPPNLACVLLKALPPSLPARRQKGQVRDRPSDCSPELRNHRRVGTRFLLETAAAVSLLRLFLPSLHFRHDQLTPRSTARSNLYPPLSLPPSLVGNGAKLGLMDRHRSSPPSSQHTSARAPTGVAALDTNAGFWQSREILFCISPWILFKRTHDH